ncbi:MAG: hypothetical protein Q7S14_03545 [bacterium]|nr:hypothetical protein [bacterium]
MDIKKQKAVVFIDGSSCGLTTNNIIVKINPVYATASQGAGFY